MAANDKPSARQLRYLRALIETTGQTCRWPKTKQQASREIVRLKQAPSSPGFERDQDRRAVKDALATPRHAASVHPSEVTGYASSARWAANADPAPGGRR